MNNRMTHIILYMKLGMTYFNEPFVQNRTVVLHSECCAGNLTLNKYPNRYCQFNEKLVVLIQNK